MALFHLGKKKEERNAPTCACNGGRPASEAESVVQQTAASVCRIKTLGSGCASCRQLYENAKTAVKTMGLSVEVEHITDMEKVMEYGVMRMPALVVNGNVVAMGKVLKANEIVELLHKLGF